MSDSRHRYALTQCLAFMGTGGILGWTLRNLVLADTHSEAIPMGMILVSGIALSLLLIVSLYRSRKAHGHSGGFAEAGPGLSHAPGDQRSRSETLAREHPEFFSLTPEMLCITDAFVTLDKQMRFTSVNPRAEALIRRSAPELLGKTIGDVLPGSRGSLFDQEYQHAMTTGESAFFEAYSESLESWMEVSAYPSDKGLAIYFRSIQERKQAEEDLRKTMLELERSNRELEDFAFVASHDLQEPLRKIQTFSDRLISKSDHLTDQERDYLARMQSAARRMQALILDLLAYSRVSTRGNDFVTCDLNLIIDSILQDMEPTLNTAQAKIDLGQLGNIDGDQTQIRQVFQNLISNAVKFHPQGQPPQVQIHGEHDASAGLSVYIRDQGIGFDPRYRERMFQPFQRLHHRAEYPGTGIGLAIVKKILDRHDATINVESAPDMGATFRIDFPPAHQETATL